MSNRALDYSCFPVQTAAIDAARRRVFDARNELRFAEAELEHATYRLRRKISDAQVQLQVAIDALHEANKNLMDLRPGPVG